MSAHCQVTGRKPGFGKSVSHSHRRTNRRWNPNIQRRSYFLPSEGRRVTLTVSTKGIKTIDRDAIEAHLTVVVTALAVARHLQDKTGMSIKKIVQALRPLQQVTVVIAGHSHVAADPLTDTAREILTATGTEWPTH